MLLVTIRRTLPGSVTTITAFGSSAPRAVPPIPDGPVEVSVDRMSPLDAAFFRIERDTSPMHVGSVAIFEGPAPTYGDVVRLIVSKLDRVPRYRQRARFIPGSLGHPVWVDDPHFQILYHVRHTAVPSPGSDRELRNLAGRVLAQALDRNKPLWEMWFVEGLEGGRWAFISKVHHAMVDGVAGNELMTLVFEDRPNDVIEPAQPWTPERTPGPIRVFSSAVTDLVRGPMQAIPATVPSLLGTIRKPATSARRAALLAQPPRRPVTSLNGPLGPHRRWLWTKRNFDEVREVRRTLGGSMNDVVLTAVTRGFRDLLIARGEKVEGRAVRTLVPVSVRAPGEHGANRVSGLIAELPVGIEDPVERLTDIRRQMDRLKESRGANASDVVIQALQGVPAPIVNAGLRAALALPQIATQTVTTNVPGPRTPLFVLGRQMETLYPYVPIGWRVRIGVAIMTYVRDIGFGISADMDAVPDADELIRGINAGFDELCSAAGDAKAAATGTTEAAKAAETTAPGYGPVTEAAPEPVAEPVPEPVPEPEPVAQSEPEPVAESEAEPEPVAQSEPEPEPVAQSEAEPEAAAPAPQPAPRKSAKKAAKKAQPVVEEPAEPVAEAPRPKKAAAKKAAAKKAPAKKAGRKAAVTPKDAARELATAKVVAARDETTRQAHEVESAPAAEAGEQGATAPAGGPPPAQDVVDLRRVNGTEPQEAGTAARK